MALIKRRAIICERWYSLVARKLDRPILLPRYNFPMDALSNIRNEENRKLHKDTGVSWPSPVSETVLLRHTRNAHKCWFTSSKKYY